MSERIIELLEENQKLRNCIEGMENDLTLKDGIIRRQTVMLAQRETEPFDVMADKNYILSILDARTLLEQLAEEASELAQAALNFIRAKRLNNNYTPVDVGDAYLNLREEMRDVLAVASMLGIAEYNDCRNPKIRRWAERLGKQDVL